MGGIWTRRYIWTLQRIHNVFWVGAARSALWIFSEQFFKVHSLKRIWDQKMLFFEEGSIFQPLRHRRISTAQLKQTGSRIGKDLGLIGGRYGSDLGASNLEIAVNLW